MTCGFRGHVAEGDTMPDPTEATESEEQQLAEMIESVDLYHGQMRLWRVRRLLRWAVIAVGAVLLLAALAWATGAVTIAALGGFVGLAQGSGPSGVERALINLQQAGRAATYASLFALAGILLLTELTKRLQTGPEPPPPDVLRALDEDEENGAHDQWMPPPSE